MLSKVCMEQQVREVAARPLDITYHLLCVAARQPSELAHAPHMFLPQSYSSDPLDHALGWHLQVTTTT